LPSPHIEQASGAIRKRPGKQHQDNWRNIPWVLKKSLPPKNANQQESADNWREAEQQPGQYVKPAKSKLRIDGVDWL
jgi:hypothetical protein